MGHGFGGTAAIFVAATRPDLAKAVITLAADSTNAYGPNVAQALASLALPTLHIGANEDLIIPPSQNLMALFSGASSTARMIEIAGGNHSSFHEEFWFDRLLEPPPSIGLQEQQRLVRRYTIPFIEWQLAGNLRYIDTLLGPAALLDPAMSAQATRLRDSLLFANSPVTIGSELKIHMARLPSNVAYLGVALGIAANGTPYGVSYLDPYTCVVLPPVVIQQDSFATISYMIPSTPSLQGLSFPCQALIAFGTQALLSNLWIVEIY
jgi:hypothetical protein